MNKILGIIFYIVTLIIIILTITQYVDVPEIEYKVAHDIAVNTNMGVTAELLFRAMVGISLSTLLFFWDSVKSGRDFYSTRKREEKDNNDNIEIQKHPSSPKIDNYIINKEDTDSKEVKPKVDDIVKSAAEEPKPNINPTKIDNMYSMMKSELVQTGKEYINPIPSDGKNIYWNNHFKGEVVILDCDIDGVKAKSVGRVLGVTKDMRIDVQFENEDGDIKIISLYNNSISVKKN